MQENKEMKCCLVPFNPIIGDIIGNTSRMIAYIKEAQKKHSNLIIFPELTVCGYPPMDLLLHQTFVEQIVQANEEIIRCSPPHLILIFGSVTLTTNGLYNSAIVSSDGQCIGMYHKCLLPNYDIFNEQRYFSSDKTSPIINLPNNKRLGLLICEDLWALDEKTSYRYTENPIKDLKKRDPDLVVVISASPFYHNKQEFRQKLMQKLSLSLSAPCFFCSQLGAQTELIFDGQCLATNSRGEIIDSSLPFDSSPLYLNSHKSPTPAITKPIVTKESLTWQALTLGLRDFTRKHTYNKGVIIGLSGGIDSSLAVTLAVKAIGSHKVYGVTMPSIYNQPKGIIDVQNLASILEIKLWSLPIDHAFQTIQQQLNKLINTSELSVTTDNIQSRIRAIFLHAIANKNNLLVINTSNKSEIAMGYGTLYGDLCGAISPLGDLYKTEIYQLSKWYNHHHPKKAIPQRILQRSPSAELRPNQKDEDDLPPYSLLDHHLANFLNDEQTKNMANITSDIQRNSNQKIIQNLLNNEFKRWQACPILKISMRSFGMGWRYPIIHRASLV